MDCDHACVALPVRVWIVPARYTIKPCPKIVAAR